MDKWDYKVMTIVGGYQADMVGRLEGTLQKAGEECWELVSVKIVQMGIVCILKRPKH